MSRNLSFAVGGWTVCSILFSMLLALSPPAILEKAEREWFDFQNGAATYPQRTYPLVLVTGGERSVAEMPQWPWPRSVHAELLERIGAAEIVILDILFNEPSSVWEDSLLVSAVRRHGRVVGSAYVAHTRAGSIMQEPFEALAEALIGIGSANARRDVDSIYRYALWSVALPGGKTYPSIALAALSSAGAQIDVDRRDDGLRIGVLPWKRMLLLEDERGDLFFWVHHPPDSEIVSYEYVDVLRGEVPPERFRGAIVLVCMSAAGMDDTAVIAGNRMISGGRFILNSLYSLLGGFAPTFPGGGFKIAIAVLFAALASSLGFSRPRVGVPSMLLLGVAWFAAASVFFRRFGVVLPVASPLAMALFSYAGATVIHMWRVHRQWSIRVLPIDSLLVLSVKDDSAPDTDFSGYLENLWRTVGPQTGVLLEEARADAASSRRLADHLALLADRNLSVASACAGPVILRNASAHSPRHRMLVRLPFSAETDEFCVLAWDGRTEMDTLRSLAALVISSATYYLALERGREQKRLFLGTIKAMAGAIDAKDPITAGHSERVADIAERIAVWLGLSPQEVENVSFAATIHDIGKIGVPDAILNKPGRLDEEEFRQMQAHPIVGALVMEPVELHASILNGILEHHERIDGKGYPGNVSGEDISLCGRIIKVADVYDALVSKRQYKEPWPEEKVFDYMWEQRGREFDARVVEVFLENMASVDWLGAHERGPKAAPGDPA